MTIPWSPNSMTYTVHEPLGVCGVIIPWNAPLMLMSLKIAPAIVAGNTVVVKSAEEAPLGVLRVAEIMNSVLPKGVMNLVSGFGEECGAPLVRHPLVKKVSFTGSVETGRLIYQEAAKKLIPATLELGGKSPMIVMPDCDLEKAVVGALSAMRFTRAGQSCTAASRMFVHDSIYDEFVRKMAAAVDKMVIGDPLDQKTDIGTIISKSQYDKVWIVED
jgi:aldehyde dehydrogenase (NAD+)